MQARRAWWEGGGCQGPVAWLARRRWRGAGTWAGRAGGCLPRGELPFAPQLALKSFPNPEEGGEGHCDALCSG